MSLMSADYILPCDVLLPPATKISKGCRLSTLMVALEVRATNPLFCPHFAPDTAPIEENETSNEIVADNGQFGVGA